MPELFSAGKVERVQRVLVYLGDVHLPRRDGEGEDGWGRGPQVPPAPPTPPRGGIPLPRVNVWIHDIEVDPTSIMDDQTRLAVARAVYGAPTLNKYAIDPAKPIRISVQNGNVSLYGVVDSKGDKDMAYIKANGVPGVFSVKNYLQVAGQPGENEKSQK